MSTFAEQVAAAAEAADFGRPSAVKRGRDKRWPYVPLLLHKTDTGDIRQEQILGFAYETWGEAIGKAEAVITKRRAELARKLALPNHRALREQHGLPRELPAG